MLVWWSILWQAETPALLDAGLRNERFRCQVSGKKNKKAKKLQTRLRKDALILALVCNQLPVSCLCSLSLFPDLPTRALGSLQGVELHHFLGSRLDVGSEIAGAVFPLDLGVGAGLAIGAF